MRYTRHIGYGALLGASMMMAVGMSVKAEEKEQVTEPVSMNPVHGVPTGINTHFAEMIGMLVSSIIGIYLFRKKER